MGKRKKRRYSSNAKASRKHKGKSYIGPAILLAGLMTGATIGAKLVGLPTAWGTFTNKDKVKIATVKDKEGDDYEGEAPLYNNGKVDSLLDEGTIVFIDENVTDNDGNMYDVMGYSGDGENVKGLMSGDYLEIGESISRKELEQYTNIYEISGTDSVNLREKTEFDDENIITTLPGGKRILGGKRIVANDNEFMWVPVFDIDEKGRKIEGYICNDYLKAINEIDIPYQESRVREMMVNTPSKTLNLRSSTSSKDDKNIIYKLPNGKIVKTTGRADEIAEATKWTEITFTDDEGQDHTGFVMNSYLEEYGLILKKVVTGKKDLNLNVRKAPGLDAEIIAGIENGTNINVSNFDIANMENVDGIDWVRVNFNDGSYGYVASQYLVDTSKDIENSGLLSDEEIQKILDKTRVNEDGDVVGIDISWMSAKDLERMLKNPNIIPNEMYKTINGKEVKYNTSDLAGKIDFVIIKIGASDYKSGTLYDNGTRYIDQALVCEKLGIPYGFYYYSTAITEEEAEREVQDCKKLYEAFRNKCENKSTPYLMLPLFCDLESHPGSRVLNKNLSNVAAYWIKRADEVMGIESGLYSGGKNISYLKSDEAVRLLKLDEIEKYLGYRTITWSAYSRNRHNGSSYTSDGDNHWKSIRERGYDADMVQTCLGVHTPGKDGVSDCDINVIKKSKYDKMIYYTINKRRERKKRDSGIKYKISQEEIENQAETTLIIDDAINWVKEHFGGKDEDDGER